MNNDEKCVMCESFGVVTSVEPFEEPYTFPGEDEMVLRYSAPVHTCGTCGFVYTDTAKEDAQAKAIVYRLTQIIRSYQSFKRSVDEQLNSGDGTYKP